MLKRVIMNSFKNMKRSMMQIYVKGSGQAVELYLKAFNATLGFNIKSFDDTFYHSELDIFGHTLAVAEGNDDYRQHNAVLLSLWRRK
jgi:hypothetical protein